MSQGLNRGACLLAAFALAGAGTVLNGCCGDRADPPTVIVRGEAPAYPGVAAKYNVRVERFGKVRARAVVRIAYKDEKGETHNEQGEGVLQVVRPDRLALSINKAGKKLFWFGCDAERYWWIDVINDHVAYFGRHDRLGDKRAGGTGQVVPIQPLDLIRLLGVVPLDVSAGGTTSWSADGRLLGIEVPAGAAGALRERIWVDPDSIEPATIELIDAAGSVILSARLSQYEGVEIANLGGLKPRAAMHIEATHPASETGIKLDLADMSDSGVAEKAFVFEEVCRALGVDKFNDLDAPSGSAGGSGGQTR